MAELPTSHEVNRYEIFLRVAELGNITRAAEALSYTQSGVSHAIKALERECRTQLLVRGKAGVSLTQAGRALLPHIQALVNQQRDLAQAIQEVNDVVAGTLRVGTFTSVSMQWLPGIIERFQQRYPGAKFEVYAGGYGDIARRLLEGRSDCGFLTSIVSEPGLTFTPLKRDQMMAILPRRSPLVALDAIPVELVARQELVMPLRGSELDIRAALDASAGTSGTDTSGAVTLGTAAGARGSSGQLNVRYALNEDFSAMAMVEKGFGISVMPELMLRNSSFDVVARPLEPRRWRTIGVATRSSAGLTALTRAFVEFLLDPANADLMP